MVKTVEKKMEIKPVRLTDRCVFDCRVDPLSGNFLIDIRGQVVNIRDYILPLEMDDVAVFASALAMMSILASDTFRDISMSVFHNPQKYFTNFR